MEDGTDDFLDGDNTPGTGRSLPVDLDLRSDFSGQFDFNFELDRSDDLQAVETVPEQPSTDVSIERNQPHNDVLHAGEDFSRALFEARWTSSRLTSLSLPWETGVMSQVLEHNLCSRLLLSNHC